MVWLKLVGNERNILLEGFSQNSKALDIFLAKFEDSWQLVGIVYKKCYLKNLLKKLAKVAKWLILL